MLLNIPTSFSRYYNLFREERSRRWGGQQSYFQLNICLALFGRGEIYFSVLVEWVPLKACLCCLYLEDIALDAVVVQSLSSAYSVQPCDVQHARLPCPLPSPGVCSNSCPLSWWCHPTISFSIDPFSSYPQSFPPSGTFPLSWLFASGGQSIGALASASVLPMSIQGWFFFRIDWFDLLAVQGTLKSLLQHHSSKALVLGHSASFVVHLLHDYWKNHNFNYMDLCQQSNVSAF